MSENRFVNSFFLFWQETLCAVILNDIIYHKAHGNYYIEDCPVMRQTLFGQFIIQGRRKGLTNQEIAKLDEILQAHDYNKTLLIAIMQDIQKVYRYLPEEALCYIAKKLKLSEAKIYGVATFYENFSLEPKGKYVIKICDGTACHVRKSVPILEEFRSILGVSETKTTTDDMLFTVETVSCLGACGLAPVCTVNDHVHPSMTPEKAKELIQTLKEEAANEN